MNNYFKSTNAKERIYYYYNQIENEKNSIIDCLENGFFQMAKNKIDAIQEYKKIIIRLENKFLNN